MHEKQIKIKNSLNNNYLGIYYEILRKLFYAMQGFWLKNENGATKLWLTNKKKIRVSLSLFLFTTTFKLFRHISALFSSRHLIILCVFVYVCVFVRLGKYTTCASFIQVLQMLANLNLDLVLFFRTVQ